MTSGPKKAIGVVIPAFGHPKFLPEAIISACEQEIDQPVKVVVVDDGCHFQETGDAASHLLAAYPDTLFYLRQENTRLPGARNTGIRFLLELDPDIDAFYFLDADNRLSPYSLQAFRMALGDDPKVGWAYPDITFFGLTSAENGMETRETAAEYSRLKHLVSNISEAGSMVRADVVRRGVWFDETMTSGFEDWDFWLSALEAGFHGVRAEHTGFLYRVRPESMLAESQRMADTLLATIRAKHKSLYRPSTILAWEHEEAPAFAFYRPEHATVLLMSDPLGQVKEVSLEDFRHLFQRWAYNYFEHFFPTHIIVATDAVWQLLRTKRSYLRWFFWQIRSQDNKKKFVSLKPGPHPSFEPLPYGSEDEHGYADMFCVSTDILWQRSHSDEPPQKMERSPYWSDAYIGLAEDDFDNRLEADGGVGLEQAFEQLAGTLMPIPQYRRHTSRKFSGPHSASIRELLIPELCANPGMQPFPACRDVPRTLLAIPSSVATTQGGLDRIKKVIEIITRPDIELALLLEHGPGETMPSSCYEHLQEQFDDIIPLCLIENHLDAPQYLGKRFSKHLTHDQLSEVSVLARTCANVFAMGGSSMVEAFGDLRRHGSKTAVFFDEDLFGAPEILQASKTKLLAYEHAIGRVITENPAKLASLIAEGFPSEKIVRIASTDNSLGVKSDQD